MKESSARSYRKDATLKRLTVARRVDMGRHLWYRHLESRLYGSHNLLVRLRRLEGDGKTLGPETTSMTQNEFHIR